MAAEGSDTDGHGALAAAEGRSLRLTHRVVARLRKPHGQQGEVAVFPLIENPGAVFVPKAEVFVVDDARRVLAGPLSITRRRAYHREWLLGFAGVTARAAVEGWRDQYLAVREPDADR